MQSYSGSSTSRAAFISQIESALGRRQLYWFGPRGADGRALLAIDQFNGAFSMMAPLASVAVRHDVSLESLTGERVDHNTYSFDTDTSEALREFRARLLSVLSQPSAIMPYRPNRMLSNVSFPRADTALHLGLFHEHQSQFEHKPWVESELRKIGVRTLPWVYVADEDRPRLVDFFEGHGQIVLRASRSDGGARVELINSPEQLVHHLPKHDDGFLCACKFFDTALPLNLNGCVFKDGAVQLHGLSEQLIGVPELTNRHFGYCGNVFHPGDYWPAGLIDQIERNALLTGRWLHGQGYLGVFGIDALYVDGQLYVVEVNPRFQGSTWAAGRADVAADRIDHYLLHLGVFLDLPSPAYEPLAESVAAQSPFTQGVQHNTLHQSVHAPPPSSDWPEEATIDLLPSPKVSVHSGAIIARHLCHSGEDGGRAAIIETARHIRASVGRTVLFEGDEGCPTLK